MVMFMMNVVFVMDLVLKLYVQMVVMYVMNQIVQTQVEIHSLSINQAVFHTILYSQPIIVKETI